MALAKTKWDMHLNYPPNNYHTKAAQSFADKVKDATKGELEIVLHPGSSLGFKGQELLRVLAEGQLSIAEVPPGMVEGDAPIMALTAQPFLAASFKEQDLLYDSVKPAYAKALQKFNQFTLWSSPWPFAGIYTNRPINALSDLKGLKMRVYDGTGEAFGKHTGIAARNLPFSEVYPAMKAGLLDSLYTSSVSGVDAKIWEMTKYFTRINIVAPINLFNINQKAWEKLSKDVQNTVLKLAKESEAEIWKSVEQMDADSVETLKKNGMIISEVGPAFRKDLDQVGVKLREEWLKKAGAEAQTVLVNFRKRAGR
jgi:TRAP-type C4-dicarboxylate transport system substrate-binding protein